MRVRLLHVFVCVSVCATTTGRMSNGQPRRKTLPLCCVASPFVVCAKQKQNKQHIHIHTHTLTHTINNTKTKTKQNEARKKTYRETTFKTLTRKTLHTDVALLLLLLLLRPRRRRRRRRRHVGRVLMRCLRAMYASRQVEQH